MRNQLLNGTVALSLALSACSLAPNYQRPEMALPTGWSNVAGVGATQQNTTLFWQEFGSADLNRLIDNAPRPRAPSKIRATPIRRTVAAALATKSICGERIETRQSPPTIA